MILNCLQLHWSVLASNLPQAEQRGHMAVEVARCSPAASEVHSLWHAVFQVKLGKLTTATRDYHWWQFIFISNYYTKTLKHIMKISCHFLFYWFWTTISYLTYYVIQQVLYQSFVFVSTMSNIAIKTYYDAKTLIMYIWIIAFYFYYSNHFYYNNYIEVFPLFSMFSLKLI
jgi:hypothetical protein